MKTFKPGDKIIMEGYNHYSVTRSGVTGTIVRKLHTLTARHPDSYLVNFDLPGTPQYDIEARFMRLVSSKNNYCAYIAHDYKNKRKAA